MPSPNPSSAREEEEQLADAIARSLSLAEELSAAFAASVHIHVHASPAASVATAGGHAATEPVTTAPQDGDASPVETERAGAAALLPTGARFYVCWRLSFRLDVVGIVVCAEPRAWPRFAAACLGRASVAGSNADFCGGPRRTPTLAAAEQVFRSRWLLRAQTPPPLRYFLLQ